MDAHANVRHPVAPSAVLPDFIFLFIFATIMILTRKTTTEYTCLFPGLQIMHPSMERQLLPAVQYAN